MGRAVLFVCAADCNYRFIANPRPRSKIAVADQQASLFAAGLVLALGAEIVGVVALVGGIPEREGYSTP